MGRTPPLNATLFPSLEVGISFKDDVTVILLRGVSFIVPTNVPEPVERYILTYLNASFFLEKHLHTKSVTILFHFCKPSSNPPTPPAKSYR
jgi:hypothetical protein